MEEEHYLFWFLPAVFSFFNVLLTRVYKKKRQNEKGFFLVIICKFILLLDITPWENREKSMGVSQGCRSMVGKYTLFDKDHDGKLNITNRQTFSTVFFFDIYNMNRLLE